jgi:hypothetical protein
MGSHSHILFFTFSFYNKSNSRDSPQVGAHSTPSTRWSMLGRILSICPKEKKKKKFKKLDLIMINFDMQNKYVKLEQRPMWYLFQNTQCLFNVCLTLLSKF